MELSFNTGCGPNRCEIAVTGEVDVSNADSLRDAVTEAIIQAEHKHIDIDLTNVDYIDSTGIGVLVGATHRAHELNKKVSVVNPKENILRIFNILGVDEQLDVRIEE